MKILITVFAYNEEKTIKSVILKIQKTIKTLPYNFTILVIDDGSTDKTYKIAKALKVKVIRHQKNTGLGSSFISAINFAKKHNFDILITIDGDDQFYPNEIKKFINILIQNKADFVSGDRFFNPFLKKLTKPQNMPFIKFIGNRVVAKIISFIIKQKFYDVSCGFRAYNKKAIYNIIFVDNFTYTHEVFLQLSYKNLKIKTIPIKVKYFKTRKSKIASNIFKYGFNTLAIILKTFRDYKPLVFFTFLSLVFFIPSFIMILFLVIRYIIYHQFSPYKFIGFFGLYMLTISFMIFLAGLIADMFVRIRINQENIIKDCQKIIYKRSKKLKE